jgi:hypothetical protein
MSWAMAESKRPTVGDLLLWVMVLILFWFMLGCASTDYCASCPPRLETQEVDKAVPCVYLIQMLEALVLPGWPPYPGHDATDEELDTWLADLKATKEQREALLVARVAALVAQLKAHNQHRPLCTEVG